MYESPTIPCETCGRPTPYMGTRRCDNCWEVERRLPDYAKAPNAWEFIRKLIPHLDDWVDGHPDAWDYKAVLRENEVTMYCDPATVGWSLGWKHGTIGIGPTTGIIARKAAALFVSLWLRGVSASFADKIMDGFVTYLERQANQSLTFLATVDHNNEGSNYFRITREGFCEKEHFGYNVDQRILDALAPKPDEEIIVTFTKRKR